MNQAQQAPYEQTWAAFQNGVNGNSRGLAMAQGTAMLATMVMGGGLTAGESAGNFLINGVGRKAAIAEGIALESPASSQVLNFTSKVLQSKFKHAGDFGVLSNYGRGAASEFSAAINQHINAEGTQLIQGAYRNGNNLVNFYLNVESGLNVVSSRAGQFITGARLSPEQVQSILTRGFLW
ncbi:hypothetical protein A0256_09605 [Mucilaginibacter sp. PAMC 26640]|nr:hypothetical protein A0256_09605 [Mucilaginibacter sp. PAMC 26640]